MIKNEPTAKDFIDNPIDFKIPDLEPFLDAIKQLIAYDPSHETSVAEQFKQFPDKAKIWHNIPPDIQIELGYDPRFTGRPKQQILPMSNPIVAYVAGRGFGKTYVLSQYANWYATRIPGLRISICAQTSGDIRNTVMRGVSGILKMSHPDRKPIYTPSTRTATYANSSIITTFSADVVDGPAGSAADMILFDELFLYDYQQEIWDQFMFTLREGDDQQIVIASTPRPSGLAKEIIKDNKEVTLITGTTFENTSLSDKFKARVKKRYAGTRLGKQELNAELLLDNPDAMFTSSAIDSNRITKKDFKKRYSDIDRIVIAVDPSMSNNKSSDLCGICVAAKIEEHCYIIEDLSIKELPERWSKIVSDAYNRHGAACVVAEVNIGGDLVELVLRQENPNMFVKKIHARFGKYTRAEPVSGLMERGQIHMVGYHEHLEEEMTTWSPKLGKNQKSPDAMDAFVYAVTELLINPKEFTVWD